MSLPSNVSQAVRFIADLPDWGKTVTLAEVYATKSHVTRAGLETRSRERIAPRYQLEFDISALTNGEFFARAQQAMLDARAPLAVPLWTHPELIAADSSGPNHTDLEIADDRLVGLFRAGDYVYFEDAEQFRQIASVTDSTNFVLETTGSPEEFYEDDTVYPCLIFEQITNNVDLTRASLESRPLKLEFRSTDIPVTIIQESTTIPVEGHSSIGGGGF